MHREQLNRLTVVRVEQLTSVQEQLAQKVVLNATKVARIREQIQIQYMSASSQDKARRLAKGIHGLIDDSLPNFSKEMKKGIRINLLKKKITANVLTISANDIVEHCINLAPIEEIKKEMSIWMIQHIEVDPDVAIRYIDELYNNRIKQQVEEITHNEPVMLTELQPSVVQQRNGWWRHPIFILGVFAVVFLVIVASIDFTSEASSDLSIENSAEFAGAEVVELIPNDLPSHLQYQQIDVNKLRDWLNGRNSLLAEEPYFSTIMGVAADYNINPLLLFAITGQEQGFVLRDHQKAKEIANNPFNVYHSWEDFNTDILESSQIAARTIVNLSKERPEGANPIQWINRKYAEDENWWKGVSAILSQLENVVQ